MPLDFFLVGFAYCDRVCLARLDHTSAILTMTIQIFWSVYRKHPKPVTPACFWRGSRELMDLDSGQKPAGMTAGELYRNHAISPHFDCCTTSLGSHVA
jgi:hypothetical protein